MHTTSRASTPDEYVVGRVWVLSSFECRTLQNKRRSVEDSLGGFRPPNVLTHVRTRAYRLALATHSRPG
jgi:hypothetical protein